MKQPKGCFFVGLKAKRYADLAGNRDAMVSIATGYAQLSSAGKVNLQDIKQMINVCHAA